MSTELELKSGLAVPSTIELTDAQRGALEFLRSYVAANDNMPTAKTLSKHFGWTSANAGYDVLVRLAKKGCIERLVGQVGWRFVRRELATHIRDAACP